MDPHNGRQGKHMVASTPWRAGYEHGRVHAMEGRARAWSCSRHGGQGTSMMVFTPWRTGHGMVVFTPWRAGHEHGRVHTMEGRA
eukprot:365505-Chlamydomonas_euryale.AAC.4